MCRSRLDVGGAVVCTSAAAAPTRRAIVVLIIAGVLSVRGASCICDEGKIAGGTCACARGDAHIHTTRAPTGSGQLVVAVIVIVGFTFVELHRRRVLVRDRCSSSTTSVGGRALRRHPAAARERGTASARQQCDVAVSPTSAHATGKGGRFAKGRSAAMGMSCSAHLMDRAERRPRSPMFVSRSSRRGDLRCRGAGRRRRSWLGEGHVVLG